MRLATTNGGAMGLTGLLWWVDRWRKSTAYTDLTLEEQAAYRNLLDEAWLRRGPIPNDDRVLAKASGDALRWPAVKTAVLAHFTLMPDGWRNTTLDEVLRRTTAITEARTRAGKRGAAHRWQTDSKPPDKLDSKPPDKACDKNMGSGSGSGSRSYVVVPSILPTTAQSDSDALQRRAGRLVERYAELFYIHRQGARYHSRLHHDFQKACDLVRTWSDDTHLEKLAVIVLTTNDDWVASTDRGFGVFAARATWADDRLRTWEIEHQIQT